MYPSLSCNDGDHPKNNCCRFAVEVFSHHDIMAETQKELSWGSGGKYECCIEVPPLDQVTVATSSESTTSEYDGDDLVSTSSSVTCDIGDVPSPRTIFGDYWKSASQERLPFRQSVGVPAIYENHCLNDGLNSLSTLHPSRASSIFQKDEQVLLKEAAAVNPARGMKRTQARRSIFGMVNMEVEAGQEHGVHGALVVGSMVPRGASETVQHYRDCFRKCKSAPALRPKSVLRSGRFSLRKNRACEVDNANEILSSSTRSVSFNEKVHVTVFQKPESSVLVEQWAGSGWSKWFA